MGARVGGAGAGRDDLTARRYRFRIWTGDIDEYDIVESEAAPFADLLRLRWVVRGIDRSAPGSGPSTFEQSAYAELDGGRIARMRLACSGDRPLR